MRDECLKIAAQLKRYYEGGLTMPEVRPIDANRFIKYLTAKKKVCEEFNDRTGVVRYQVAIDETKN